jgi:hypothetical protein
MMKDYIAMTSQSLMTLPATVHKRCAGRRALYWPIFSWLPYMFPATMPKFKGGQKTRHFEQIFEISSPCCLAIKDLQLLCRLTTRYSRKFRDKMLCLRHSTHGMRPIQNVYIFRFSYLI